MRKGGFMKEITGIYGTAKVFSDVIDARAE